MRKWRNLSRLLVILGMVALVYFNLYEKKVGQLGSEEEISQSVVLSLYDNLLKDDNQPMLFRGDIEGGLWSLRIYSFSLSDPLAFLSASAASTGIDLTLFLSILIPLLILILFGRSFCSWICPYSLLAEAGRGITRILHKVGIDYFNFDLPRHSAYFYLILSLILGAILGIPITTLIYPPRVITEGIYHLVVSSMISTGLIFIIFLWLGEVIFSPHLFCRRVCPGGALFSILGRFRVLRIKKNIRNCDMCGVCNPACPYTLNPALGQFPGECDNCGLCIDACRDNERDALNYKWKMK